MARSVAIVGDLEKARKSKNRLFGRSTGLEQ